MHFGRGEESFGIDLTPLVDTVFLLLIFFMVSTHFIEFTKKLDIELPEAKGGTVAEEEMHFVVEMGLDGTILLNGESVTLPQLETHMKASRGVTRRSVVIKADRRLHYGNVIQVMGICKDSGVRDIGVAVK